MLRASLCIRFVVVVSLALSLPGCSKEEAASPEPATKPAAEAAPAPVPPQPQPPPSSTEANTRESVPELQDGKPLSIFEGTLPCADCAGIRTVLTLYIEPDRYTLEETRLGTPGGDAVVRSEGAWSMAQGAVDSPEDTLILLDPGSPEDAKSFLAAGDEKLELLDREGKRMLSDKEHMLMRRPDAGS